MSVRSCVLIFLDNRVKISQYKYRPPQNAAQYQVSKALCNVVQNQDFFLMFQADLSFDIVELDTCTFIKLTALLASLWNGQVSQECKFLNQGKTKR